MLIPTFATALSTLLTNAYFPPLNTPLDGRLEKEDSSADKNAQLPTKSIKIAVPFNDDSFDLNFKVDIDFFLNSKHSSFFESFDHSMMLLYGNFILSFDYNLELTKVIEIKLDDNENVTFMKQIDCILVVLSTSSIYLVDPKSGGVLSGLKLCHHFTKLKPVISLISDEDQNSGSTILAVYSMSSYCQLINIDLLQSELSLLSKPIYLSFWPVCFLSTNSYIHFLSFNGRYQSYKLEDSSEFEANYLTTSELQLDLLDSTNGRLVDIEKLDSKENSFIFLQEKGWSIYKFSGNGKNASLNCFSQTISSPLSSSFEKFIRIDDKSYILMSNRDVTSINQNNIHLIDSKNLLEIFNRNGNGKLLGFFNEGLKNTVLKELDGNIWKDKMILTKKIKNSSVSLRTSKFIFTNESNRLNMKNISKNVDICTLFDLNQHLKLIDLSIFSRKESASGHFNFYLLHDSSPKFQLLVLNSEDLVMIKNIKICFPNKQKITEVNFLEDLNILEFKSSSRKSLYLSLKDCKITTIETSNNLNKLQLFNDSSNKRLITGLEFLEDIEILSFSELLQYQKDIFNSSNWIGIMENTQTVFYHRDENSVYHSPVLFLICFIFKKEASLKIIDNLITEDHQNNTTILKLFRSLTRFCFFDDDVMVESTISLIYTILLKDPAIIKSIYEKLTIREDKLCNMLLIMICILIDNDLFEKFDHLGALCTHITKECLKVHDKILEICIETLSKFGFTKLQSITDANNDFDIIQYFSNLFYLRSLFFNDPQKKSLRFFKMVTVYLNGLIDQDPVGAFIIMSTILESKGFSVFDKLRVLDYINYVLLEKSEFLDANEASPIVMYLLINSVLSLPSNDLKSQSLEKYELVVEAVTLFFTVIDANFKQLVGINNIDNARKALFEEYDQAFDVVIALDFLGYHGIIFSKSSASWSIKPLKIQQSKINKLDDEINNSTIDVEHYKKLLFEKSKQSHKSKIRYPVFTNHLDRQLVSMLNLDKMTIQVWDISTTTHDVINIDVLKDETIPLKLPDINILLLQHIWSTHFKKSGVQKHVELNQIVKEFHNDTIKDVLPADAINSPLSSPRSLLSTATFKRHAHTTYAQLSQISMALGEYHFGFIIKTYISVFPDLVAEDLSIHTPDNTSLQLFIKERPVYVFGFV